jgi:hypothetical protein
MRRTRAMVDLTAGDNTGAVAQYRALYDDLEGSAKTLAANGLGLAAGLRGDHAEAEFWFTRCLEHIERRSQWVPLLNIALTRLLRDRVAEALPPVTEVEQLVHDETLHHRGYAAVILAIVAVANRERAMVERVRQRALFHLHREAIDDVDTTMSAIAVARRHALTEHLELLELLERRIQRRELPP